VGPRAVLDITTTIAAANLTTYFIYRIPYNRLGASVTTTSSCNSETGLASSNVRRILKQKTSSNSERHVECRWMDSSLQWYSRLLPTISFFTVYISFFASWYYCPRTL